jgi:TRAP-type C4-dicarboxylate transport system permease small subunit
MAFATIDRPGQAAAYDATVQRVRRVLDLIYLWSGYLAAASMVTILVLTLSQMATRYAGVNVRGLSDYAGYFMAASAFLAFPLALNRGAHVRIELVTGQLGRYRRIADTVAFGLGFLIAAWFAFYSSKMVYVSWKFGDLSTGLDATPLWIPQLAMAIGAVLFAVAILDQFCQLVFKGSHSIRESAGVE